MALINQKRAVLSANNANAFLKNLPWGAIGVWAMDGLKAAASGRVYVPNLVDPTPVTQNLVGPSRRNFVNSQFWKPQSLTVTDNVAVAPDGANDASTLVSTGTNWFLSPQLLIGGSTFLPAGTYTIAVNVKWNGTGNAAFKLGDYNRSDFAAFTATTSWQRFSHTITPPSNNPWPMIYTPDGASSCNFTICDYELFNGPFDLGPSPTSSHIYFCKTTNTTPNPVISGGLLDLSTGVNLPYIQFNSTKAPSFGPFSFIVCGEHNSAGYNNGFQPYIANNVGDWNEFSVGNILNSQALPWVGNSPIAALFSVPPSAVDAIGHGNAVTTVTYDGTTVNIYLNGALLFSATGATTPYTVTDLAFGFLQTSYYSGYKYGLAALYKRALSATEVATISGEITARELSVGVAMSLTRLVMFEGHSICAGSVASVPNNSYAGLTFSNASPAIRGTNVAVGGSSLSSINARLPSDIALAANLSRRGKIILFIDIGANDIGLGNAYSGNPNQYLTDYTTLINAFRASGVFFKIVGATIISRTSQTDGGTQFDSDRAVINPALRAMVGTTLDAIADFAANTTMGANGAANNTTYFNSGVHPTDAGHALMAPYAEAAINGLWTY